jgi:hypothetical protein
MQTNLHSNWPRWQATYDLIRDNGARHTPWRSGVHELCVTCAPDRPASSRLIGTPFRNVARKIAVRLVSLCITSEVIINLSFNGGNFPSTAVVYIRACVCIPSNDGSRSNPGH